jgi:hypothetical protein
VIDSFQSVIGSFHSQVDRNSSNGVWDLLNPPRIAENHVVMENIFTNYLLNTSTLINNSLTSNFIFYIDKQKKNMMILTQQLSD